MQDFSFATFEQHLKELLKTHKGLPGVFQGWIKIKRQDVVQILALTVTRILLRSVPRTTQNNNDDLGGSECPGFRSFISPHHVKSAPLPSNHVSLTRWGLSLSLRPRPHIQQMPSLLIVLFYIIRLILQRIYVSVNARCNVNQIMPQRRHVPEPKRSPCRNTSIAPTRWTKKTKDGI